MQRNEVDPQSPIQPFENRSATAQTDQSTGTYWNLLEPIHRIIGNGHRLMVRSPVRISNSPDDLFGVHLSISSS